MRIGRCCAKVIERIRMEGERALVEHHVGCGCIGMRILLGRPREMGALEGGLVHVVSMMREEKNSGDEVGRSIAKLAQYCEWGTSRHVRSRKILKIQRQVHGLGV